MKYQDYYAILGVDRKADHATIKKAYRKLARQYHPDVNSDAGPAAEEKFKQINEAYDVLKDAEKRSAYDQFGSQWKHGHEFNAGGFGQTGGGFNGGSFSDFFESIFSQRGAAGFSGFSGAGQSQGFRSRAAKGENQQLKLDITLEEALTGGEKTIQLSRSERQSSGVVTPVLKKLKVNIPKGVRSGQKIRLSGQGHEANGHGPRGDLILELTILPHRLFQLEGQNIVLRCPVTPWEAALGASIKVPTLSGEVELKLPAGVQSGKRMRLKGRGLPASSTEQAGDFLVEMMIHTPMAENQADKLVYQQLQQQFDFNPRNFKA